MTRASSNHRGRLGFRDGDKGTHSSGTMMLSELETLLAATGIEAGVAEFRCVLVEENVLGKRTATTREHAVRKPKALYGLDPTVPVYSVMRRIWGEDTAGHPLLALRCAAARDRLLRASADAVLDTPLGSQITRENLDATVRPSFSPSTSDAIGRNLASSWTQAGFLAGVMTKSLHARPCHPRRRRLRPRARLHGGRARQPAAHDGDGAAGAVLQSGVRSAVTTRASGTSCTRCVDNLVGRRFRGYRGMSRPVPRTQHHNGGNEAEGFAEIFSLIASAREHAARAVNVARIDLYWSIGLILGRRIATDGWGKNPPGSPWGEERIHDRHLTLAETRAARGEA